MDKINENRDRPNGGPQQTSGAKDDQGKTNLAAVAESVTSAASTQLHNVQDTAEKAMSGLEKRIRHDPKTSMAIAAGAGFLIGALITR